MFKLSQDKKSFIPFIMAGVPDLKTTKEALLMLDKLNVGAIELGVPFTDPIADGPVNQEASMIGLKNKVTLRTIFSLLSNLQWTDFKTPIILFTYLNPILSMGFNQFIALSKKANVQAVLIVDLPVEEGEVFYRDLYQSDISSVLLVSPTTSLERCKMMSRLHSAFIYYISRCAVTGVISDIRKTLSDEIATLREIFSDHAIAVGFGISTATHAKTISAYADAVIVGSALMMHLNQGDFQSFKMLSCDIQQAISEVYDEKM